MGKFRTDWKGAGRFEPIADALNKIGTCLNNLNGFGVLISRNSRGGFNFSVELERVTAVQIGGGRRWERAGWTGTASDYLRCPYDGATAPSFVTQEVYDGFDWDTMPADDGSDDRANAMYIRLSETRGPVFHVHRA